MGYVLNVYLFIRILSVKGGYLFHLFINRILIAVTPSFTCTYSICHPPSYLVVYIVSLHVGTEPITRAPDLHLNQQPNKQPNEQPNEQPKQPSPKQPKHQDTPKKYTPCFKSNGDLLIPTQLPPSHLPSTLLYYPKTLFNGIPNNGPSHMKMTISNRFKYKCDVSTKQHICIVLHLYCNRNNSHLQNHQCAIAHGPR